MPMKTCDAIKFAGSAAQLAQILGVTKSAVSQYGENIPSGREWQLRVIRPDWFKKKSGHVKKKDAA